MLMSGLGRAAVGGLALLVAWAAVATPASAQRRRGNGAGIAAGVIGGVAAGAILGGALSGAGRPAYGAPGAYDPAYADGPEEDAGCGLVRRPVYDAAGRLAGYQDVPNC